MTMMEICLSALVGLNLYSVYKFKAKYKMAKNVAVAAIATAAKHEQAMAEAATAIKRLVAISEKAGCDMEAVKYKSLVNRLEFGLGMAEKLEVL